MNRWIRVVCAILFLTTSGLEARDGARLGAFEGTWMAVSVERGGKKLDEKGVREYKLVVKDDKWWEGMYYTVTFDNSKSPKETDRGFLSKGRKFGQPGIYKLEGDTLTISRPLALTGGERPKDFLGGEKFEVVVYKRSKN